MKHPLTLIFSIIIFSSFVTVSEQSQGALCTACFWKWHAWYGAGE